MALRIMIVEDEPITAMGIQDILRRAGHEVVGRAASKAEAFALAAKSKPHVAVVDVMLDGKDVGVDVAEALGARHGIRVLFLTASPSFRVRAMAIDPEPLGYVMKPHSKEDILEPLQTAE